MRRLVRAALLVALAASVPARAETVPSYALLQELTSTIGHRLTGSDNGARAEEFAARKLREAGFSDVRLQTFPYDAWVRGDLALTIGDADVAAAALAYSPASADVAGELADAGNGTEDDYAGTPQRVRGKIALVYLGVLPGSSESTPRLQRVKKVELALAHGAIGVIFINQVEGNVLLTGAASHAVPLSAPAIVIGHDDGMRLKERLATASLPARIVMHNRLHKTTARNVIVTIKGGELPGETIVFGGHLDSWDLATGAVDNGACAMAILDIARSFKQRRVRPRRTIQFVLFMGEEQGDLGSFAFVDAARADGTLRNVRYMLNADMSVDPYAFDLWGFDGDRPFFEKLGAEIRHSVPAFKAEIFNRAISGGDSDAFLLQGIPILYLRGTPGPDIQRCYHADCDRIELVTPEKMRATTQILAMSLSALANAGRLPAVPLEGEARAAYLKQWKFE